MPASLNQPAPDFTRTDQNGKEHSLADYREKWLLLYFYPEDDTPGCTTEACNFRDAHAAQNIPDGLMIVGISGDTVESHDAFVKKFGLNFTLLADPEKKTIAAYGTDKTTYPKRTSFLIDPDSIVRKVYDKVDAGNHADEVMQDVRKLLG